LAPAVPDFPAGANIGEPARLTKSDGFGFFVQQKPLIGEGDAGARPARLGEAFGGATATPAVLCRAGSCGADNP
jgi:hypothetical protein